MSEPETYGVALLVGLALDLQDADLGVWRETGVYSANERGILIAVHPNDPDEIISLTRYDSTFSAGAMVATRIQIRYRLKGSPLAGERMHDALQARLHDRTHVDFGSVRIDRIKQRSFSPLGKDSGLSRWQYSQNFEFTGLSWSDLTKTPSGD